MIIQKFDYNYKKLTAICYDDYQKNFLWIAFSFFDGYCKLLKVSANDPKQIYYELDVEADKIVKIINKNPYIYILLEHDTYVSARIHKTTPLTTFDYIYKPSGLLETPVDICSDNQYIYYLLPGLNGNDSRIYRPHPNPLVLSSLITLTDIHNATAFAKKDNIDNLWITINEKPGKIIRVYEDSGWKFQIIDLS